MAGADHRRNMQFHAPRGTNHFNPTQPFSMPGVPMHNNNLTMMPYPENRSYTPGSDASSGWHTGPRVNQPANTNQFEFDVDGVPPFLDLTLKMNPNKDGVIKISNVPFNLTSVEVFQFLQKYILTFGALRRAVGDARVHIIMERPTAKTMDCFVELNQDAVDAAIRRSIMLVENNYPPKMGGRLVDIERSNQGELMQHLFPSAKRVAWDPETGVPTVFENTDTFYGGFRGFVTFEELTGLVRHAEFPHRSPFSSRTLQRTYECMVSTLLKFPWATSYYTVRDRDRIFDCYFAQLQILAYKVVPTTDARGIMRREVGLDNKLLHAFVNAGLWCPGFSERQKALIAANAGIFGQMNTNSLGSGWPFETLCKPPHASMQDVGMWIDLLHSGANVGKASGQAFEIKPYGYVGFDKSAHIVIHANPEGLDLAYTDYARVEAKLMSMVIEFGWEQWFVARGMTYERKVIDCEDLSTIQGSKAIARKAHEGGNGSGLNGTPAVDGSNSKHSSPIKQLLQGSEPDSNTDDNNATTRAVVGLSPWKTGNRAALSNIIFGFSGGSTFDDDEVTEKAKPAEMGDKKRGAGTAGNRSRAKSNVTNKGPGIVKTVTNRIVNAVAGNTAVSYAAAVGDEITQQAYPGKQTESVNIFSPQSQPDSVTQGSCGSMSSGHRSKHTSPTKSIVAPLAPIGTPPRHRKGNNMPRVGTIHEALEETEEDGGLSLVGLHLSNTK